LVLNNGIFKWKKSVEQKVTSYTTRHTPLGQTSSASKVFGRNLCTEGAFIEWVSWRSLKGWDAISSFTCSNTVVLISHRLVSWWMVSDSFVNQRPKASKMLPATLLLLCVTALEARALTTTNEFYSTTFSTLSSIASSNFDGTRYTYISVDGQSTVSTASRNATGTASSSDSQITRSQTSQSLIQIGGLTRTSNGTSTGTSTSTGPAPTNTVPCNGYPEFCQRQYSNITEVCAHNSAFAIQNNAGSNQEYGILDQLNDGVRMRE